MQINKHNNNILTLSDKDKSLKFIKRYKIPTTVRSYLHCIQNIQATKIHKNMELNSSAHLKSVLNLTQDELRMICKRYYLAERREDKKFKILSHDLKQFNYRLREFLSDRFILKVTVIPKKVSYERTNTREDLSFFVKLLQNTEHYVPDCSDFNKEILLYQFVLPRLQDIPICVKKWAASCFLTRNKNLLIFEDVVANGYRPVDAEDGILDFKHLEVAVKTVARLHASSIIFEERTHITLPQHFPGYFTENAYPKDRDAVRNKHFRSCVKALVALSLEIPRYKRRHSSVKTKIQTELPAVFDKIYELCEPSRKYRNVLNHSDLWVNNIMFKYETSRKMSNLSNSNEIIVECDIEANEDGYISKPVKPKPRDLTPVDALLCDFQLSRYAPPSLDVMSLIIVGTTSDFRRKHLDSLLSIYMTTFANEILRDEIDVKDVLMQIGFEATWEHYELAGLIESCLFNGMTLLPDDVAHLFSNVEGDYIEFVEKNCTELWLLAFETNEIYRERLSDSLVQIIENYVL